MGLLFLLFFIWFLFVVIVCFVIFLIKSVAYVFPSTVRCTPELRASQNCDVFSSPRVKVLLFYCASSPLLPPPPHPPPASASCSCLLHPPHSFRRIHSLCRSSWGPARRPRAHRAGIRLPKLGGPKSCLSVTLVGAADSR